MQCNPNRIESGGNVDKKTNSHHIAKAIKIKISFKSSFKAHHSVPLRSADGILPSVGKGGPVETELKICAHFPQVIDVRTQLNWTVNPAAITSDPVTVRVQRLQKLEVPAIAIDCKFDKNPADPQSKWPPGCGLAPCVVSQHASGLPRWSTGNFFRRYVSRWIRVKGNAIAKNPIGDSCDVAVQPRTNQTCNDDASICKVRSLVLWQLLR